MMDRDKDVEFHEVVSGLLWGEIEGDDGVQQIIVLEEDKAMVMMATYEQFEKLLQDISAVLKRIAEKKGGATDDAKERGA